MRPRLIDNYFIVVCLTLIVTLGGCLSSPLPPPGESEQQLSSAPTPRIRKLTPLPTATLSPTPTTTLAETPTVAISSTTIISDTTAISQSSTITPIPVSSVNIAAAVSDSTKPPSFTATAVSLPPTDTPLPPTATPVPPATPQPTPPTREILTDTPSPSPTFTPTSTNTFTPTPSATSTSTATHTPTPTNTPIPTPSCGSPTNQGCLVFISPQLAEINSASPFVFTDQPDNFIVEWVADEFHSEPVSLKLTFKAKHPNFGGWGIGQLPSYDVTRFQRVTFHVKGTAIGRTFEFKMKDMDKVEDTKKITVSSLDWAKVSLDLNRNNFPTINFEKLENINLGFNDSYGDVTIYVDDFIFE